MAAYLFPKKREIDPYLLRFLPRMPTLDELCKGLIGNVYRVLKKNQEQRKETYSTTKGYTRSRCERMVGGITIEVQKHPELGKYFQAGMDRHERKKNLYRFLRKYPQFKTVDNL